MNRRTIRPAILVDSAVGIWTIAKRIRVAMYTGFLPRDGSSWRGDRICRIAKGCVVDVVYVSHVRYGW